MKHYLLHIAVILCPLLPCSVRAAYTVDNQWHTNVWAGVTSVTHHGWAWAKSQVHEFNGGTIDFDVDETPFETGGGYFSVPVTIRGMNRGTPVIFSTKLRFDAEYSEIYDAVCRGGIDFYGHPDSQAERVEGNISGAGDGSSFHDCTLGRVSCGSFCLFSGNRLEGSIQAGDDNIFSENTFAGATITASNNNEFEDNEVDPARGSGRIRVQDGNTFRENTDMAIELLGDTNRVFDCRTDGGFKIQGNENECTSCEIKNGGMEIRGTNNRIAQCTFHGNSRGIEILGVQTEVEQCTIYGNSSYGIYEKGYDTEITKCRIHDNGTGIGIHGSNVAIGCGGRVSRNYIYKNMGHGIKVTGAKEVCIEANYIGTLTRYGSNTNGNMGHGIYVGNSEDIGIGQSVAGAQNLIRGSAGHGISYEHEQGIDRQFRVLNNVINGSAGAGICIDGGCNVRICGNYIGTDESDQADTGNLNGVTATHSPNLLIGGELGGARNIISGNKMYGVLLTGDRFDTNALRGTRIMGNYIGVTRNGDAPLPNQCGIRLEQTHGIQIGGDLRSAVNVISGNTQAGIVLSHGSYHYPPVDNHIYGNLIGTDGSGVQAVPNQVGIRITGHGNHIGSADTNLRNVVSGNLLAGIQLHLPGYEAVFSTSNNYIHGNYIGTDISGRQAVPNMQYGIYFPAANNYPCKGNFIGGTNGPGHREGNVISGNGVDGLFMSEYAWGNHIDGNGIGISADGLSALSNARHGIHIISTSDYPRIYANTFGLNEGNVISGNGADGIHLTGEMSSTRIYNSIIGMNAAMSAVMPNGSNGISIIGDVNGTVIGATRTNGGNVICGNAGYGIYARHEELSWETTEIHGNFIGASPEAFGGALCNGAPAAVFGHGGSQEIGNALPHGGNIIDGPCGVLLETSKNSRVTGNYIGFMPGTTNVSSVLQYGITIRNSRHNVIGGQREDGPHPGNTIGGAEKAGIYLVNCQYPQLKDNTIGCARNANGYVTNAGHGIVLTTNCIGAGLGEHFGEYTPNFIAGNQVGILMENSSRNQVTYNWIGIAPDGYALGNRAAGVRIIGGGKHRIGDYDERNLISGNGSYGVHMIGSHSNEMFGNTIGLDADGNACPNQGGGILIENGCVNSIGHQGYPNVISANAGFGLALMGGSSRDNRLFSNRIGIHENDDTVLRPNTGNGIQIDQAHDNELQENSIIGNGANGIQITGDLAVHNRMAGNIIYSNALRAIRLGGGGQPNDAGDADTGPNHYQNHPVITNVWRGTTHVYGYLESTPNTDFSLEFVAAESLNANGYPQARVHLGYDWVQTDAAGRAPIEFVSWYATAPMGWIVTGTATTPDGDTSEFTPFNEQMIVTSAPEGYQPGGRDPDDWTGPDADVDGDRKADPAVFDPAHNRWYIRRSTDEALEEASLDGTTCVPVPGDYDGDTRMDIASYQPEGGWWRIRRSSNSQTVTQQWGWAASLPVPGDYDGDGKTDIAVYDGATGIWYIRFSSGGMLAHEWGDGDSIPVPADYDGDDVTDTAVYDLLTGTWSIHVSFTGTRQDYAWGWQAALPVPGDYDGDRKADLCVYHPETGNWYIRLSATGGALRTLNWGWQDTDAFTADYDGDSICDPAVYDRTSGRWFILYSGGDGMTLNWGWSQAWPVNAQLTINHWFLLGGLPAH